MGSLISLPITGAEGGSAVYHCYSTNPIPKKVSYPAGRLGSYWECYIPNSCTYFCKAATNDNLSTVVGFTLAQSCKTAAI